MSATAQTRVTLAAAAATLLAALALQPLVEGLGWFVAVVVVVAVVSGTGAVARQLTRWAPVVVAAQVAALAVGLTVLFAREGAVLGVLPGWDAVLELRRLIEAGLTVTREEGPPVTAAPGVILLVAGGIGLVGLVVDVIAVTLRRPAVAGLPLLAVYCVPAAVLPGGLGWLYFVLGGAGYLLLVAADAGDRVSGWGRVLGSAGDATRGVGGPLSGARRIGTASLAVAVLVPALVPGLGERMIGSGSGTGTGAGPGNGRVQIVNPILHLRANLTARDDKTVLTYRTTVDDPAPLRIVTDDEFDGTKWQPGAVKLPRNQRVQGGLPDPPGLSDEVATKGEETTIQVLDLAQTYLPLPYPTTKVDVQGTWLWDRSTLNVVGADADTRNLSYRVDHLTVTPTAEELDRAGPAPQDVIERYTRLPDDLPPQIAQIARERSGDSSSTYQRMLALQRWLRNSGGFQYSEQVGAEDSSGDGGQGAVLSFLQQKRGYCVQFASAFAVMARTLRVPARVAVGFLPGQARADGTRVVSLRDAHAWPEVYFQGVGWVRFEPTPAVRASQAPSWAPAEAPRDTEVDPSPSASASAPATAPRTDRESEADAEAAALPGEQSLTTRIWSAIPWRTVALVVLALLLLLVPLCLTTLTRRRRWAGARTRLERVEAAWDELRDGLGDLGVGWATSWTPRALERRLATDHLLDGAERAALARLVGEVENARYAPPGGEGPGADSLRADVRTVVEAVAATRTTHERRRARWLPASGVEALRGAARRVDAAADEAGRRASDVGAEVRRTVESAGRRR